MSKNRDDEIQKAYVMITKRATFVLGKNPAYSAEDLADLIHDTMLETLEWEEKKGINGAFSTAATAVLEKNFIDFWRTSYAKSANHSRPFQHHEFASGAQDPSNDEENADEDNDAGEWLERTNIRLDLERAFAQFNSRERDVLFARFAGGYTWEEIAEMFPDRSCVGWRVWLTKTARPKLKKFLKDYRPTLTNRGSATTISIEGKEQANKAAPAVDSRV